MALFELEDGRLVPAQFGREVPDGFSEDVLQAVRMQVLEIVSRPLFPIAWSPGSGGDESAPRLTALDAAGQVVAVEVVAELDADVLIEALSRLADSAAMSWTDLARQYPHGIEGFKRGWAKFRETMPTSPPNGPRMVLVAANVAPEVRPALDVLSSSGVEVHEMSLRQTNNGRAFLEVEPVGQRLYNHRFTPVLDSTSAVPTLAEAARKSKKAEAASLEGMANHDVLARRGRSETLSHEPPPPPTPQAGVQSEVQPEPEAQRKDPAGKRAKPSVQKIRVPEAEPAAPAVRQPVASGASWVPLTRAEAQSRRAKAPSVSPKPVPAQPEPAPQPEAQPVPVQQEAAPKHIPEPAPQPAPTPQEPAQPEPALPEPVRPAASQQPPTRMERRRPRPASAPQQRATRADHAPTFQRVTGSSAHASAAALSSRASGASRTRSARHERAGATPAGMGLTRQERRARERAQQAAVQRVEMDAAGLTYLARMLGDDVSLSLSPASRGPRSAILSLEGQIIVPAGAFTDPSQALRAMGIYGEDGWGAWHLGDERGPTLRESIEEINRGR